MIAELRALGRMVRVALARAGNDPTARALALQVARSVAQELRAMGWN